MVKLRLPKLSLRMPKRAGGGPLLPRPVAIGLIAFVGTVLAVALAFGAIRLLRGGEVLGSVDAAGVDLGGLGETDALAGLQELEDRLASTPITATAAGRTFTLDPRDIGFDLDADTMVAAAMRNGRKGNVFGQFGWWVGSFGGGGAATVEPVYTFDADRLAAIVEEWEVEGIGQGAYPGDVRVENGAIVYEYPADGIGIEREAAMRTLEQALLDTSRSPVTLTTRLLNPDVTSVEIDAAVAEASALIAGDVTLTEPTLGFELVLPRHLLARALVITRDDTSSVPEYSFDFDETTILDYVAALGPYLETEPVDAEIVIDDENETVTIVPSVPRQEPDRTVLMEHLMAALQTPERIGELAYAAGREADFSTADAEALGIRGVIGEFTTYHPCCAPRVTNIHLIAAAVDGALIMPGESFSLNDWVGKRTVDKGYVCAPALQGNETVEEGEICIGGGTSQFTTTLYNAAFFAGLEDVSHQPHSVYFTRYPEGREATLGWRQPELIFRNNTPNAIIIKTSYTDTQVTAKIYGDNGGLVVTAGLSNRYNHTSVVTIKRPDENKLAYPHCDENSALVAQEGGPGWSVTVYRYITYPDGTQTTESWAHRYAGAWRILEWDADDPTCPGGTTTTTTEPASTTSAG